MIFLFSFVPKLHVMGIFETLEDLYEMLKTFLESLGSFVITLVDYTASMVQFVGKGVSYLITCFQFMPTELQVFLPLTLTLSVILLILGRTNNNG